LLDEVCELFFGYIRKHAIKLLGGKACWGGKAEFSKGRPPVYGKEVEEVLYQIWKAAKQPSSKRLVLLRQLWIAGYEKLYGKLDAEVRRKVMAVSAAQIDQILAPRKVREGEGRRCGTKPGGLLKTQIPVRTDNWEWIGLDIWRPIRWPIAEKVSRETLSGA
jgi:hypothetical protein